MDPKKTAVAIRNKYREVISRIADAAEKGGRSADSIRCVVVSKNQPLEVIRIAFDAGIRIFGENYAEEAVSKIAGLGETGVEWHMIGHVQSRKADLVAEHFSLVHSLDSLKLATRLDHFCNLLGRKMRVLLEFNVSAEASKTGFAAWDEESWDDLIPIIEGIISCSNLEVHGLMTMPPLFDEPELARPFFVRLSRLRDFLAKRFPQADWADLSMGTSSDYVIAVQEGATLVRIGTAILGPRID